VPDALEPLWGVDVLGTPPDKHLAFRQFHALEPGDRKRFLGMLQGKEAP